MVSPVAPPILLGAVRIVVAARLSPRVVHDGLVCRLARILSVVLVLAAAATGPIPVALLDLPNRTQVTRTSRREKGGGREEGNRDSTATIKDVKDRGCVEGTKLREPAAGRKRRDSTHKFGVHETARVAQRARTWSRREERPCQHRGQVLLSARCCAILSQRRLTHWAPAPFRRRGGTAPQTCLSLGSRRVLGLRRRARGHPKRTSEPENRRRDGQTDVTHLSASGSSVSLAFFRGSIHGRPRRLGYGTFCGGI